MIETKENIKYQEQESVEFVGEFTKPQFKAGNYLKNKEDGRVIVIIAIVGDQYKYDEGGELNKYVFFECIEAQYDIIRSKDDITRNAASGFLV